MKVQRRCFLLCISLLLAAAPSFAKEPMVTQVFDAAEIKKVVLRSGNATSGTLVSRSADSHIKVSGVPNGGAKGYHTSDKNWKETKAVDWGMAFESKVYGNTLVISSKNELAYIHHRYYLKSLVLEVPRGVEVVLLSRELNGDGAPDLSEP